MPRTVLRWLAVVVLAGTASAGERLQEGRVLRFEAETSTLVLSSGGRERALRMDGATRFLLGKQDAIVSPRTARLVLRRGVELEFEPAGDDRLATVRFGTLPPADSSALKPLPDLGPGTCEGEVGGLYPGGTNGRPLAHEEAGMAQAAQVRPLDIDGRPSRAGRVVLLSVGMSNATQEFSAFKAMAERDRQVDPSVLLVDGAQGGMTAARICDPESADGSKYWETSDVRLSAAKATPTQVQVVWLKEADSYPNAGFPEYAKALEGGLERIVRYLPRRYPNLRLAYLSCRSYGGYATTILNPEPFAYESGFAVKWLVGRQIAGDPGLAFDESKGPRKAPWLSWGPYLWASGKVPNADGLAYEPSDFGADGTHPSPQGLRRIAERLLRFFKTDRTTKPWFLGR